MDDANLQVLMGLIINSGNSKNSSMEAIEAAKQGDFDTAKNKIIEAGEALSHAHKSQTSLLTAEAQGNNMQVTLLTIHAQDHLMNAITFKDLAAEIVDLYTRV